MTQIGAVLLFSIIAETGWAQITVWPGDANDDGIANHLDILNIGIGFGKQGNPRDSVNNSWTQQQVQQWNDSFPDSKNLAHADCSGNGFVNLEDIQAIEFNYDDTNSNYTGISFLDGGPDDPVLMIIPHGSGFHQEQEAFVTLYLEQLPEDSAYGLAFTFEYDTTVIKAATVSATPHPQFGGGGRQPVFVQRNDSVRAKLEFGISRTNGRNHGGSIAVCNVHFVIEGNLIGKDFLDFANAFRVKFIRLIDKRMNNIPVRGDSASAKIMTGIREKQADIFHIYPVPASDKIFIDNNRNTKLVSVELVDLRGIQHATMPVQHDWSLLLDVALVPEGIYVLRIVMEDGVVNKKVLVKH